MDILITFGIIFAGLAALILRDARALARARRDSCGPQDGDPSE